MTFFDLPFELYVEIFLFLDIKYIPSCLLINKETNQIDKSEYFWETLFNIRFKYGCPDNFKNIKTWRWDLINYIRVLNDRGDRQ